MEERLRELESSKSFWDMAVVPILIFEFICFKAETNIALLLIMIAVVGGWGIKILSLNAAIKNCREEIRSRDRMRENVLGREYLRFCEERGCPKRPISVDRKNIWVANNTLYEAEWEIGYTSRYPRDLTSLNGVQVLPVECKEIKLGDIQVYAKEGDIQYTTQISGGGGGGSSITGALIGGAFAGSTGAIIGSRKKVNEIKSKTITHDNRKTVLRYEDEDSINVMSYSGHEVYDLLISHIPNKDLLSLQLKTMQNSHTDKGNKSLTDRLTQLQELFQNGLLSETEYNQKRQDILKDL